MACEKNRKFPEVKCSRCGTCCSEPFVPVTHKDLKRLVSFTGKEAREIVRFSSPSEMDYDPEAGLWIRVRYGKRAMVLRKKVERCVFLSSQQSCTVYQARPRTCRTFPYSIFPNEKGGVEVVLNRIVKCKAKKRSGSDFDALFKEVQKENREDLEYERIVSRWNESGSSGGTRDFLNYLGF
ncbi:MAG: YkgJ family cysteine cluster protein [Chitinispirillaceae bacterium]